MVTEEKDIYNILFDSMSKEEQDRLIDMYAGNLFVAIARVIWKNRKRERDNEHEQR